LAAAKPWNAKLVLGVVSLLRKVNDDVAEGAELVAVVPALKPPLEVVVDD
jgi:hypothetical protein